MQKGREDAEFKKRMIERSNFSTVDLKKPSKDLGQKSVSEKHLTSVTIGAQHGFKSGFEKDGAQIIPRKNKIVTTKPRPPLHHPKAERKLKPSTVKDLLQKEQKLKASQIRASKVRRPSKER